MICYACGAPLDGLPWGRGGWTKTGPAPGYDVCCTDECIQAAEVKQYVKAQAKSRTARYTGLQIKISVNPQGDPSRIAKLVLDKLAEIKGPAHSR